MRVGIFIFLALFVARAQASDDCSASYHRMLADQHMSISIAYGYNDLSDDGVDWTMDEINADTLVHKLTQICVGKDLLCGFELEVTGSEKVLRRLSKQVEIRGESVLVEIDLVYSSYTFVDTNNKTQFVEEQNQQTEFAKDFFVNALKTSDVVFYSGHSRDGGGPDFSPPTEYNSGGVNYNWYYQHRPGVKDLKTWLGEFTERPEVFGLFSCASKRHFRKLLQNQMPQTELVLSRRVVPSKYTKQAMNLSLENLLSGKCSDQVKDSLSPLSFEWLEVK